MSSKVERLSNALQTTLMEKIAALTFEKQGVVLDVKPDDYLFVAETLRDDPSLKFEQLMDLSGIDYQLFSGDKASPRRYAVASQLLSLTHNWRLTLRVFCEEDHSPTLKSLSPVWPSANWYEREAFDLFGIMFKAHPDLRRILTDYGFVGHPFRKDFPISGFMEMRYDAEQKRVIYQPVTIEPREIIPRIVREKSYGDCSNG